MVCVNIKCYLLLLLVYLFIIFAFTPRNWSNFRASSYLAMKRKLSAVTWDSADNMLKESLQRKGFIIDNLAPTSWVSVIKGVLPPEGQEFEELWSQHPNEFRTLKIHGRDVEIPRYQQAFGKSYRFSGSVAVAVDETPLITQVKEQLNQLISVDSEGSNRNLYKLNSCLCNWYEPDHYIGAHSDDTRPLVARSPIVGLSWGATRTFTLTSRTKDEKPDVVAKKRILMESGDVIIMGGDCQETHKHEIEKLKKGDARGNRVSFTFRCFKA